MKELNTTTIWQPWIQNDSKFILTNTEITVAVDGLFGESKLQNKQIKGTEG